MGILTEISTASPESIIPFVRKMDFPFARSHKGQNGKVLVIGGSSLFHASSLWSAETVSHFVDMVHYASTKENAEIFVKLKSAFRNGIVVPQKDIHSYAMEDDVVLVGPGMMRDDDVQNEDIPDGFENLGEIQNEALYARALTRELCRMTGRTKLVIDAGALQMLDPQWISQRGAHILLTPHLLEFERCFGIHAHSKSRHELIEIVTETAKKYSCTILLKAVDDFVSDGTHTVVISGGNAGLTKGGTGDVLAGLCAANAVRSDLLTAAVISSFVVKKTAEKLYERVTLWYNTSDLVDEMPAIFSSFVYNHRI